METAKNQRCTDRKFKHLETAHNELVSKLVDSTDSTLSKIAALESRIKESESANIVLVNKIADLEDKVDSGARV